MGNALRVDSHRYDEAAQQERARVVELNRVADERWDDNSWRREMAQEMTETIYWGFEHENILQLFSTVENVDFNGRSFIKEVRGLRAFWMARGGYIEASDLHQEVVELQRDTVGFHVYEMEDKLRTSFGETQATLVDLGIQRMDATVNQHVLATFQTAVPSTSPFYINLASGLTTLAPLNRALREVRDQTMDPIVTILGRATMTDQIIDALMGTGGPSSGFFPETNERLLALGVLGVYRGARIITLKNYKDDIELPFFPANELWVIGRDASKFAFWGGLWSKEFSEEDNWYWHYLARRDFGGMVYRPNRLRRLVDATIDPNLGAGGTFTYP